LTAGLILSQRYGLAPWATMERRTAEVVTPGLTWNSDSTVTLNTGVFHVGDFTLTVVNPPGDAVGIPEPASLILLASADSHLSRCAIAKLAKF
jgi:hypothetical protein